MSPAGVIDVRGLFPELSRLLMELLQGLSAEDWQQPTVCAGWTVKDVVCHLLDGSLRRLSFERDGFPPPPPSEAIGGYRDLVGFLNRLNAEWIVATRRLSPRVLVDLTAVVGREFDDHVARLDPLGPALFSVAWAGEEASQSWFDIAREFTEKWHHQQQIRDAVGAAPINQRRFLYPVLDTFLRAVPHAYRHTAISEGTAISIRIDGAAGGDWTLRDGRLFHGPPPIAAATIRMDQEVAWRLFTKAIAPHSADVSIDGDAALAQPLLGLVAVMAARD